GGCVNTQRRRTGSVGRTNPESPGRLCGRHHQRSRPDSHHSGRGGAGFDHRGSSLNKSSCMLRSTVVMVVVVVACCAMLPAAGPTGIWIDVPFVKQEKDGCGAASIAMVMQYWLKQQGKPLTAGADAARIQRALYSRKARGIYASDLEHYLQKQGFQTFAFA